MLFLAVFLWFCLYFFTRSAVFFRLTSFVYSGQICTPLTGKPVKKFYDNAGQKA
jgi:hypothetical protein